MKKLLLALMASSMLLGCNPAASDALSPDQIKASLMKQIPGLTKITAVNKSPISNLYEVVVGRKIFYVTGDGKYLIFGNVIDTVNKKSLTEERTAELSRINWQQLPLNLAITEVNGNGKNKIAVFSDPDCPYCQMFEQKVAPNLKDTTIYTFMFPLPIHPHAKTDAAAIWCSKDRSATWTSWMRNKVALPANHSCDTSALDTIAKVGTDVVQIEGTPTIILENGQILPGMLPPEQLMAQMKMAAHN